MIIDDEITKILEKYNIDYKKYLKSKNHKRELCKLLMEIDEIMTQYILPNDEPQKEWLELEKAYDRLYYLNNR